MLDKKTYANGQRVYVIEGDQLTFFFKNGRAKATGAYVNEQMEGEWRFYRESGQLWQVGNFQGGQKHGAWVRYSRAGEVEHHEEFTAKSADG